MRIAEISRIIFLSLGVAIRTLIEGKRTFKIVPESLSYQSLFNLRKFPPATFFNILKMFW
jgi:hypothetical protein